VPSKTKPHLRAITVYYYPYDLLAQPKQLQLFVNTLEMTVLDLSQKVFEIVG